MKKRLLSLLLSVVLLLGLLAACGQASSPGASSLPARPSHTVSVSPTAVPSIPNPLRFFQRIADVTLSESDGTAAYTLRSKQDLEEAVLAYCDLLTGEYGFLITYSAHPNGDFTYHLCYNGPAGIQKTDTFDIMVNNFGNDHPSTNGAYGATIRVKQADRFDLVSVRQYTASAAGTPAQTGRPTATPSPSPSHSASPSPTPSSSPSATPAPTPSSTPAPTPSSTPTPTPTVDPSSKLLPDLEAFLYRSASSRSYFGDTGRWGRWLKWNGSHPYVAYETIVQELLDLLLDERYQLKLTKAEFTPRYSNRAVDYYFEYTGTAEDITLLTDEKGEYTFHVRLRFYPYPEHDYFQFSFAYNQNFVLEDPGERTTRNITKGGDGEIITTPPTPSSGGGSSGVPDSGNTFTPEASRLDCLTCRGDGDCNTCGGDGYTGFGSAKAGCRTCHGNGKCRACGGSGKR